MVHLLIFLCLPLPIYVVRNLMKNKKGLLFLFGLLSVLHVRYVLQHEWLQGFSEFLRLVAGVVYMALAYVYLELVFYVISKGKERLMR